MIRKNASWLFIITLLVQMVAAQSRWHARAFDQEHGETLTNESIIRMTEAGVAADIIEAKIGASDNVKFDLTTDGLIRLKEAKVPSGVIRAMLLRARASKVQREQVDEEHADAKQGVPDNPPVTGPPVIAYGSPSELRGVKSVLVYTGMDLESRNQITKHIRKKLHDIRIAQDAESADVVLVFVKNEEEFTAFVNIYTTTSQRATTRSSGTILGDGGIWSTSRNGTYSGQSSSRTTAIPYRVKQVKGIGVVAKLIKPNKLRLLMMVRREKIWWAYPSTRVAGAFVTAYKKANRHRKSR